MNLSHLRFDREQTTDTGVVEIRSRLAFWVENAIDWRAASGPAAQLRRLLLLGQAEQTLLELRALAPSIFLLTNDGPDTRPPPYDFGNIAEGVLQRYEWRPVRRGFGDEGTFERDTDFDNCVIEAGDGALSDFVTDYLGGQMHPIRYVFCFAEKGIQVSDVVEAVQSALSEEDLWARLCEKSAVVTFGFEEETYVFFTSRQVVAEAIKSSLGGRQDGSGHC